MLFLHLLSEAVVLLDGPEVGGLSEDGTSPKQLQRLLTREVEQEHYRALGKEIMLLPGVNWERMAWRACESATATAWVTLGPVSWAGAPGLGYAGSFPGAPPQDPMGFPSAGISRCLLPCSVLRLAPGFSGPAEAVLLEAAHLCGFYREPGGLLCC
jgi:hypothetical protein